MRPSKVTEDVLVPFSIKSASGTAETGSDLSVNASNARAVNAISVSGQFAGRVLRPRLIEATPPRNGSRSFRLVERKRYLRSERHGCLRSAVVGTVLYGR